MLRRLLVTAVLGSLLTAVPVGQLICQDGGLSIILKGNYTTSSEIFPNPNASDAFSRSQSFLVEGAFGYGVEVKYRIPRSMIAVGASVEYLEASFDRTVGIAFREGVPVEDGYRVIPLEVTGYFIIPFSTRTFQVYIGGGVGMYIGGRTFRLAGVDAPTVDSRPGFGIHVVAGVGYGINDWLSIVGEMKFRDLQFASTNDFPNSRIEYGGAVLNVNSEPFESKVHTDGIVFQLGAAFTI
ncbi:MAG: outer membrane beta-barrel protein [Bacteroidetes bacterium]|nr:outer membrane beta-barrel protein [Bacteroidota bacterium]